jgi:DNA-binding CsgD family transcriptional regulator
MEHVYQNWFNSKEYSEPRDLKPMDILRRYNIINRSFESTYFILEASTLKIKNSYKSLLHFFGITPHFFKENTLFELIVENIHPSDVYKVENYLNYINSPGNSNFLAIIKLKNCKGVWRHIYINTIVDKLNNRESAKQFFVCCIDMSDVLKNENKLEHNTCAWCHDSLRLIAFLSKREKEIMKLVVQGYTDKEVACKLNISSYTAITHRKNIISKLKVKNTASLAFTVGTAGIF